MLSHVFLEVKKSAFLLPTLDPKPISSALGFQGLG